MGMQPPLRSSPECPSRSLWSARALGVPPEATPCSPTPRQVKRASHRRAAAPPFRARAEVPPAEGGPGSRGLSGLSAPSRLAGGCPGHRRGSGIPGTPDGDYGSLGAKLAARARPLPGFSVPEVRGWLPAGPRGL